MSLSRWTPEMTDTATRLWQKGYTALYIAECLGVSRCAVIGKMSRMGVKKSGSTQEKPVRKRRPRIVWSDEMTRTLKRMWDEGTSAKAIAKVLGLKETAIYTKQRALGLSQRGLQGHNRRSSASAPVPARSRKFPDPQQAPAPDGNDEPESLNLALVDLTNKTCRWPHGEVGEEGFGFCGHEIREGTPYCEFHAHVAYPRLREGELA